MKVDLEHYTLSKLQQLACLYAQHVLFETDPGAIRIIKAVALSQPIPAMGTSAHCIQTQTKPMSGPQ